MSAAIVADDKMLSLEEQRDGRQNSRTNPIIVVKRARFYDNNLDGHPTEAVLLVSTVTLEACEFPEFGDLRRSHCFSLLHQQEYRI